MVAALCVGAGGFVGAVLRYLAGLALPGAAFPVSTFFVNVVGSFVIGLIVGAVDVRPEWLPANAVLFLKTGVCGGFTTFSTFSLETFDLMDQGSWGLAAGYAVASVACCVAGVFLGRLVSLRLMPAA